MKEFIQKAVEEFDKKFGKPTPDKDGELFLESSVGEMAGCDDCFNNQKERQEHRDFLQSSLTSAINNTVLQMEEIIDRKEKEAYLFQQTTNDEVKGYYKGLRDLRSSLDKLKV